MYLIPFMIAFLLLTGCQRGMLNVYTEYISIKDLASYHVGTPDPRLYNPPFGEQLMINWKVPTPYLADSDLHLLLRVRYGNHEETIVKVPIKKKAGLYIFPLEGDAYCEKRGIQSYRIELRGEQVLYDAATHLLWKEWIQLVSLPVIP